MRIISGRFKRRVLISPEGQEVRPTTDRTREAMFNLVGARLDLGGARVADLFCGSGSLGLEALSRGAAWIEFVDRDARSLALAQQNARSLDEFAPCRFVRATAMDWAAAQPSASFNLILADPPYRADGAEELVDAVLPLLAPGGLFILEHDRKRPVAERTELVLQREYGKSAVAVYRADADDD